MDIKKLEQLSCLSLDDNTTKEVESSLLGIIEKINDIIDYNIDQPNYIPHNIGNTNLDIINTTNLVCIEDKVNGLHIEDTKFLAPKVLKK